VVEEVLHPGVIGIACWWRAVDPALVVLQQFAAPVAVVERRVGEDVIGLQVRMLVVVRAVAVGGLPIDAVVVFAQAPRRGGQDTVCNGVDVV